jgi:hypothetical protein
MKKLRRFCAAVILALTLTLSAIGGDIGTPGAAAPPPPPAPEQSTTTGDIGTPGAAITGDILTPGAIVLDPVTSLTLSLLESVFYLF